MSKREGKARFLGILFHNRKKFAGNAADIQPFASTLNNTSGRSFNLAVFPLCGSASRPGGSGPGPSVRAALLIAYSDYYLSIQFLRGKILILDYFSSHLPNRAYFKMLFVRR
jgi:hypothetical protein